MTRLRLSCGIAFIFVITLCAPAPARSEELHSAIDRLIEDSTDGIFAEQATDFEFLRRLFLDLTGEIPAPSDVTDFVESSSVNKRAELIDRLLKDERYPRRMSE